MRKPRRPSPLNTSPSRDPQWLEAQYNNRARVPEHAAHFARWAEASALARQHTPHTLDLPFGAAPAEQLDVFAPAGAVPGGRPVLVFVHGGYWRSMDKAEHHFIAPAFVQRGACVVFTNYTLCPAVTVPQIALQTVQAIAWVWRHIARWGGDPSRMVVAGHSAGGHLAAMALACQWPQLAADLPPDVLSGALGLSGLYELDCMQATPSFQASLQLSAADAARASPAWMPAPGHGRFVALAGGDESAEFHRHNRLIQQAWGRRRVPVCQLLAGHNHFTVLDDLADPQGKAHAHACELLGLTAAAG